MSTLVHSPLVRPASFFAVLAQSASSLGTRFADWRSARRKAREDEAMWAMAQQDPRVMTDLVCALRRGN